ncbi:MAG: hypothetical protein KatS3mg102_1875 [Planctomycetota bacterium]|nr:MAG: hypothetical protein KatS3mg102_1875 [Planctomycetota bacterium]
MPPRPSSRSTSQPPSLRPTSGASSPSAARRPELPAPSGGVSAPPAGGAARAGCSGVAPSVSPAVTDSARGSSTIPTASVVKSRVGSSWRGGRRRPVRGGLGAGGRSRSRLRGRRCGFARRTGWPLRWHPLHAAPPCRLCQRLHPQGQGALAQRRVADLDAGGREPRRGRRAAGSRRQRRLPPRWPVPRCPEARPAPAQLARRAAPGGQPPRRPAWTHRPRPARQLPPAWPRRSTWPPARGSWRRACRATAAAGDGATRPAPPCPGQACPRAAGKTAGSGAVPVAGRRWGQQARGPRSSCRAGGPLRGCRPWCRSGCKRPRTAPARRAPP